MKEIWRFDDTNLVVNNGFTPDGLDDYWSSIDAALRFNIVKHKHFLSRKPSGVKPTQKRNNNFGSKVDQPMRKFFKKNRTTDRFHWHNNKNRRLPTKPCTQILTSCLG